MRQLVASDWYSPNSFQIRFVIWYEGRYASFFSEPFTTVTKFDCPKKARAFVQHIVDGNRDLYKSANIAWIKDMRTGRFV